jgi:hypothetical protein
MLAYADVRVDSQVQLLMGRYRELAERKKAGALRYSVLLALPVQMYKYRRTRRNSAAASKGSKLCTW